MHSNQKQFKENLVFKIICLNRIFLIALKTKMIFQKCSIYLSTAHNIILGIIVIHPSLENIVMSLFTTIQIQNNIHKVPPIFNKRFSRSISKIFITVELNTTLRFNSKE